MNLERRIEELIQKYNNEIDLINRKNGNYSSFTDEECEEAREKFQNQINSLESIKKSLNDKSKKIADLEEELKGISEIGERQNKKNEIAKAKKELKEYTKEETKKLNKPLQGKVSNIVSTYIGQIDKRIHNTLYANNNKRWGKHEERVKSRYEKGGLIRYVAPRALAIGLGVAAVTIAPGGSALIPLMFGTTGTAIFNGINFAFAANVLTKTAHTIYNKIKFGGPLLDQKKKIYKGKYLDNINSAFDEYDNTKGNALNLSISKSADISPKPAAPTSGEKDKIDSNVARIINDIGVHFEDGYSDDLDNLYNQALMPAVQEEIRKRGLEEMFSKMEETVRNGRETKEKTEHKTDKINEEKVKSIDSQVKKIQVKELIAKVDSIDPNNLDRALVDECIDDLNKLNNNQRQQLPQSIYLILGKARKMCEAQGKKAVPKKPDVYESELNTLVERVNLDKINNVLKNKSFSKLTQDDKRLLHDELVDIRNILNIISSENIKNTSLDGKNIGKLNQIVKLFGENNLKVNKAIPDSVEVELFDVTDKTGTKLVGFSGKCDFYAGSQKAFERMISFKTDDENYIRDRIRKEIYGFDGEIIIKKNEKSL